MSKLKQEIRLWVSSGCGNQKNCRYPYEKVVSTTEDLKTAVAFDHTFISFKNNYRNGQEHDGYGIGREIPKDKNRSQT